MKKVLVLLSLVVFVLAGFSEEIVGYLMKDGKILSNYYLTEKAFKIEYLNSLQQMQQNGQQFDPMKEPFYMVSTIKTALSYKILEYYANENNYKPNMEEIDRKVEELASQYLSNEDTKKQIISYFGSEDSFKDYIKNNLLASYYYKYIDSKIGTVTENEVNEYIEKNFEKLKEDNDKVLTQHILVTDEATANKILNEIKSGKISFEDAAKKYSIDKNSAVNGGEINWVTKKQVVEPYFLAAWNAKIGSIVGPVKTDYGYHLIKVKDKKIYNSPEDMENNSEIVEKIKSDLKNEKLYKWYMDYSKQFDFAIVYKPLIYEDRIQKAKTIDDLMDIEKKLFDAIKTDQDVPEEWKLSYVTLAKKIKEQIPEIIELEKSLLVLDNKYKNLDEKALDEELNKIEEEISKLKDSPEKKEKDQLKTNLENLYYIKIMYPYLINKTNTELKEDIKEKEDYSRELNNRNFIILKEIYMKNKDMNTLVELYQLNPEDPEIAFDYNYSYYNYIKQYIQSQPKDVIQPELEKLLKAFEGIVEKTDNPEIKSQSEKIIEEIKTTLKNMMQ
ncbi:parvulin-like peptidyl-prolyl isomerase [Marinitoga piezophila KA3]|uniref:Parvulin-like peptidyl-prolyl isomerase n=1 Tax=Marinitoga piezophila (strain DSM 14283 / JCM 11233 / KA3) TaxID=443254 RepID=H2J7Y8_MARPK|nr:MULTISPECIES: peptidylprolyl isomerase [Marinitoga]AEX85479.1 parvulin-like peptidyl-prolyl isomerase [Marinitoga piezophila KA3]APT75950.1 hypothetical protein LN42_05830 [Marinitoga sp. 1137]